MNDDKKPHSDEQDVHQKTIEDIRQKYMNKCRSVKSKVGPFSFYFNPITTILSAVIIWTFVVYCIFKPTDAKNELLKVKNWVTDKWTWLYIGTKDVWGLFIIYLYFSKYSELRLGSNDEKPEYSDSAYFMMLFSAGLGIGLFYYGVAEPIYHYKPGHYGNRFYQRYSNNDEAQDAINLTFFHWGIHSWIVYVIIGLLLGFLSYRRGLPLTMRTCLYPIIGDKIFGIMGDLIDTLCIICTMFGVCTSLGLGAAQLNNGIHRINPKIEESILVQIIIIWCVTACATLSVVSGVKFGIRRLSELCFGMGTLIMVIIFFADNTSYLLNLFVQSIGYYLQWLIQVGFHTEAFAQLGNAPDNKEAPKWIDAWTIFYWGWWVSWSPFVGMFIAKISRGRKIKEFIFYTLTVPTVYSLIWMTVFGGVGIQFENKAASLGMNCSMYNQPVNNTLKFKTRQSELFGIYGTTMLSCRGTNDMWFDVMNMYGDIGMLLSILSLIAIILYFVTSSDSGSLVIDCLSANGSLNPPIVQRIFWSLTEGATATALLVAGGKDSLEALQTVSVACGLPITIFLNWACVALWRAIREEAGEIGILQGRWKLSMWSLNNRQRLLKSIISLFFPWYYLSQTKRQIENKKLLRYTLLYSVLYAIPFYTSALLVLAEPMIEGIKYIACLSVRGRIGPFKFYFNPLTSALSAIIIWAFVAYCISQPVNANRDLIKVKRWVTDKWTWLYIGTHDAWLFFIVVLYFSKYSSLKLGRDDEKPEYSDSSYFMMLFSAGVGIFLFYYGVAEPIYHYKPKTYGNRFYQRYNNNQQAQDSINLTYFHWGIHGWIVYVIIGLLLGFLSYRRGLPLTMRTCFYPILGEKIFGVIGDLIDTLCIICTMFGVCTSLGLGAVQLNNGLHRIDSRIKEGINTQIVIIWCVTVCATASVVSGLKFGIKFLSKLCFGIGSFLMLIVFFFDNTVYILNLFVQSFGYYLQYCIQIGFHTEAFAQLGNAPDNKENPNWIDEWTIFYWGMWISWSPFVGMFIAKISRGRTIKNFIFYTLTIPSIFSFFWFTVFGGVAIQFENTAVNRGMNCSMYTQPIQNMSKFKTKQEELYALFGSTMLSCRGTSDMWFDVMNMYGDYGMFLSILSLIAIVLYFVTSSDSGSLVIDCLSANGNPEPPVLQRIFWSFTEGATATAMLVAGGVDSLKALQTVSVACGLPFTICLNWTCVAMWRVVREEAGEIGEKDGRWQFSMWSWNCRRRIIKSVISILFPWYYLAQAKMNLENKTLFKYFILFSVPFALPFYLWMTLMIVEMQTERLSYIGWAVLVFFFVFGGSLRYQVREKYNIEGDMIEDIFCFVLVYPIAIMQIHEQIEFGSRTNKEFELITVNKNRDTQL